MVIQWEFRKGLGVSGNSTSTSLHYNISFEKHNESQKNLNYSYLNLVIDYTNNDEMIGLIESLMEDYKPIHVYLMNGLEIIGDCINIDYYEDNIYVFQFEIELLNGSTITNEIDYVKNITLLNMLNIFSLVYDSVQNCFRLFYDKRVFKNENNITIDDKYNYLISQVFRFYNFYSDFTFNDLFKFLHNILDNDEQLYKMIFINFYTFLENISFTEHVINDKNNTPIKLLYTLLSMDKDLRNYYLEMNK